MDIAPLRALVADDMAIVDRIIRKRLESDVALINQLGNYIVGGGGKRLRPMVVLIMARACGHPAGSDQHALLGAIVEMIHTATLLHDDVVDESEVRRGRQTANALWGNEASVLVGDFLYTRAFEMMVALDDMPTMATFSRTTNRIAEGEVMQLMHVHDPDVSEDRYREVIYRKTAVLFEAGCELAARLALGSEAQQATQAAAAYGRHLGTAFQLADDALDYDGNAQAIGKNIGDDLAEGKPTLPLIHCLQHSDVTTREMLRQAIETGGQDYSDRVADALAATRSIEYVRGLAEQEAALATQALEKLPENGFSTALASLATFSVTRSY
ncbi:octaprenyl diphosphate synthase [Spiribacter sp. C176]|uniref:Octaprenyl diphosphate synthase n=1 Tax=Spiribacter salilacus TaxID=2664894 RepID=A0A6N7QRS2_9GAMM|nr:polyprenyl synthetase family protein [Spiribacter salilacus]MRH78702.1 octaprenyl diphosphate synthase [Spiribacter salilacus]